MRLKVLLFKRIWSDRDSKVITIHLGQSLCWKVKSCGYDQNGPIHAGDRITHHIYEYQITDRSGIIDLV